MTLEEDLKFPKGFLWGTATAAHQIEGNNTKNNWYAFEQEEGRIHGNEKSGKACDSWNRYEEDFNLIKTLNNNAYRMSIEWSRVYPEEGIVDEEALQHYHSMIDALIARGITPFITLHHFTNPLWFEKKGGLLRKQNVKYFEEFVCTITSSFKNKVRFYNTINEPNVVTVIGYVLGKFPPGKKSIRDYIRSLRNLMRMHATAYKTIKDIDPRAQVGIVKNIWVYKPFTRSLKNRFTSRLLDYATNQVTMRAVKTGKLPLSFFFKYLGLKNTSDFIGLNFYNFVIVGGSEPNATAEPDYDPELLCSGIGWQPFPEGIYLSLKRLHDYFGLPVYITENGIGTDNDAWRQKYIIDHLKMVHRALREGVDVKGYFHWSLIDNFEWAEGRSSRFGLVHVDFSTFKRTMRESGRMYAKIAENNAIDGELLSKYSKWPLGG